MYSVKALDALDVNHHGITNQQVWAELGIEAEPEIENAEIEGPEIEA